MTKTYKKYGVTTDGYRGKRAILTERIVEGLQALEFNNSLLQLDANSPQTIYLNSTNFASGNYIVLPDATTLWPNWQVAIINETGFDCPVYYYTSNYSELNLFQTVAGNNMKTCILLDDLTSEGTWTTLRTLDQTTLDTLDKYTSNVLENTEITWNELQQDDSDSDSSQSITVSLGKVLAGTALRSIYVKTVEQFTFEEESDNSNSLNVSVGIASNYNKFIDSYELTNVVADNNFTKDIFEEILSTDNDEEIFATFTGTNLINLVTGKVSIVVEKAKLIDPTVLKNPIVQTQLPIGVIMNYVFNDIPDGFWRLDGSILPNASSAIPQFVKKLNLVNNQLTEKLVITESQWNNIVNTYGSCGKFCWVGGGLRFPKINCFIQGLNSLYDLGKLMEAGLPNITSEDIARGTYYGTSVDEGAIHTFVTPYTGGAEHNVTRAYDSSFKLDASWSSSVYGKSNTVQPESIRYPYIISVYNKIQNASTLDLNEIIEDSVNKANISLNNLSVEGIDYLSNLSKFNCVGKPNYNAGLSLANNTTYNLDYDVWVLAHNEGVNFRAYMTIYETQYAMSGFDDNDGHGSSCMLFFPAGTPFSFTGMTQIVAWPII